MRSTERTGSRTSLVEADSYRGDGPTISMFAKPTRTRFFTGLVSYQSRFRWMRDTDARHAFLLYSLYLQGITLTELATDTARAHHQDRPLSDFLVRCFS